MIDCQASYAYHLILFGSIAVKPLDSITGFFFVKKIHGKDHCFTLAKMSLHNLIRYLSK